MTTREAIDEVMRRRSHISHGLLKNKFFLHLGSCWYDRNLRCTSKDHIYVALAEQSEREMAALADASSAWNSEVAPALRLFLDEVTGKLGFVPTNAWGKVKGQIFEDLSHIEGVFAATITYAPGEASNVAKGVWERIDQIMMFVDNFNDNFWDYFEVDAPRRAER